MAEFTIGVEEEYQLVDPTTGELRSRAREVLAMDWGAVVRREVQQTMLEAGTRICADGTEARAELKRMRLHVGTAAAAQELGLAGAGLHPFSRWERHTHMPEARYERLVERFGRVMRTEHVFGMHVHVGTGGADRMRVIRRTRRFLPHMIALSASSPFYEGEDTGYASYRTILTGRLPCSGVPPLLESEDAYWEMVRLMVDSGAVVDKGTIYWSVRPHPVYDTVEFRAMDVCPDVEDAAAIASLLRILVAAAVEGPIGPEDRGVPEGAADALLASEVWRAARYGLDAELTAADRPAAREPMRDAIHRLLERIAPVAEALGETAAMARIEKITRDGNAADTMRARCTEGMLWNDFMRWLQAETQRGVGLDPGTSGAAA